jgi:HK97 gp10 family phage protein
MINTKLQIVIDPIPKIEGLKNAIKNKIVRKAITQAGKPILKTAKATALNRSGALKFSLALKTKTRNNYTYGIIGPKSHYQKMITKHVTWLARTSPIARPARYAHLIEKGTKKSGAHAFLSTSFSAEATREQIREAIAEGIREAIR